MADMSKYVRAEKVLAQRVRAIRILEIEVGRIRRNYTEDAPEQDVFTKVARYLKVIYSMYKDE